MGSENKTDIIAGEAWLCWYRMGPSETRQDHALLSRKTILNYKFSCVASALDGLNEGIVIDW